MEAQHFTILQSNYIGGPLNATPIDLNDSWADHRELLVLSRDGRQHLYTRCSITFERGAPMAAVYYAGIADGVNAAAIPQIVPWVIPRDNLLDAVQKPRLLESMLEFLSDKDQRLTFRFEAEVRRVLSSNEIAADMFRQIFHRNSSIQDLELFLNVCQVGSFDDEHMN